MHQIGGIILSPTRELALQTYEVVKHFADVAPRLKAMLMTGEPAHLLLYHAIILVWHSRLTRDLSLFNFLFNRGH